MLNRVWIAVFALLASSGNAAPVYFSGGADSIPVNPSGSSTVAAVNCFAGKCNDPTSDNTTLLESVENIVSYIAQQSGTLSAATATLLVSASLPFFGDQTPPGPVYVTLQWRAATWYQGYNDTELAPFVVLPTGTYDSQRVSLGDDFDGESIFVDEGDRVVLQLRFTCPEGCNNQVIMSLSLACTLNFAPLVPQLGCPANTLCVNQVSGNDLLGSVGGLPFATIGGALATAAQIGGDLLVWVYPGTYFETPVLTPNVDLAAISQGVTIASVNPPGNVDLVTMAAGSTLQGVALSIVSNQHARLRGIVFSGTSGQSANVLEVTIMIDNSGANSTGSSDVMGVYTTGLGWNGATFINANMNIVTMLIKSTGNGRKAGILLEFTAGIFLTGICRVTVTNSSSGGGAGTYYGVQTNTAGSVFAGRFMAVSGSTADISQTLGTISLAGAVLVNSNANGLGFTTSVGTGQFVWCQPTGLVATTAFYAPAGGGTSSTESFYPVTTSKALKSMYVVLATGPSNGNSCSFTVRKNGVNTGLTLTAAAGVTRLSLTTVSVSALVGDLVSLQFTCTGLLTFPNGSVITLDYF